MIKKKIPLYPGHIIIEQVKSLRTIEKKYKTQDLHGIDACAFRYHTKKGYLRYVLAFDKDGGASQVAHEAMHVVSFIYSDLGIFLDTENDEPQSYLIEWIVKQCHKYLKLKK